MLELLWLIPAIPFASAAVLALVGNRLSRRLATTVGVGSIALSAALAIAIAVSFLASPPDGGAYSQTLWTWIEVAGFHPQIGLYLDALSLVMILVVTFVGFLIHLYSSEFMAADEGYSRFFAYMNLFVASMLTLLLGDNLLLLYLGWEGVGLCSYLLIGFWYRQRENGRAAQKAFIVTRVGDTAMALGLFLLFTNLGTLHIQDLMHLASSRWAVGAALPTAAAFLLLGGAVGKSAQLPLQVWLPDAMAGPTPVSALIHAATMVTAGVYLIARTHALFSLAPAAQTAVATVGAATLLLAGTSALTQWDLKRVLAYSTVSQIGYMFLALGVGAWPAAIFHFMTHACFKALLFLGAGVIINAQHDDHNIFRMGGLRRELPTTFWTFLIAGCSLSGLPLVTAGYFSKDLIMWNAWSAPNGHPVFWIAAMVGAFLTALYTARIIFKVFFGSSQTPVSERPGAAMTVPLVVLAVLSVVAGYIKGPFLRFIGTVLPPLSEVHSQGMPELASGLIALGLLLLGVYLAWFLYLRRGDHSEAVVSTTVGQAVHQFWFADWGFDWLYDKLFIQPFLWISSVNKSDFVDSIYRGIAGLSKLASRSLSASETGRVRWYAAGITLGAIVLLFVVLVS
jgi:NADH-quinone oxidoreductase subunit L